MPGSFATGRWDARTSRPRGDWVAVRPRWAERKATIHGVLPRRSKFSRKAAGAGTEEQVLAANIDTVFLVTGLDDNFNLRRIERYLVLAWESGASPVIVLSKSDLCPGVEARAMEVESVAPGVPIHVISALRNEGLESIRAYLQKGRTAALLGSSGVGKSTLINRLVGKQLLRTQEVRPGDHRGKYTTTHRELIALRGGGLIIDTPGLRELQLWDADEGTQQAFQDIQALAEGCYFGDCQHEAEPDCAVQEAVAKGTLSTERLESYRKLQKELRRLTLKQDQWAQLAEKKKLKAIMRAYQRLQRGG